MPKEKKQKKKDQVAIKFAIKSGLIVLIIALFFGNFFVWQQWFVSHKTLANQKEPSKELPTLKSPEKIPEVTNFNVPILMYHYIRVADPTDSMGIALSVTPENFDAQMNWLQQNNYQPMKLADLADPQRTVLSQILHENKKPIIITFDDGYDDAYTEAMPILQKHNFFGTFFIIRNFVGRPEYATQAQIAQMAAQGMEVGSHTLDHKNLAAIPLTEAKRQIFDSKLDASVFCYPSGEHNGETMDLVKSASYVAAVTTIDGISNQDSNLFELPRVRIKNVDLETFAKRVEGLK